MYLRKQTLEELNLGELATCSDSTLDETAEVKLGLQKWSSWLLPQLVQHYSSWRILGDGKSTVLANCQTPQQRGLWRLLRVTRSKLVKSQNKNSQYSQLVPLFLLAHKRYNNRSYESWRDYPQLEWLVEPELLLAMQHEPPLLDGDELREIIESGLTTLDGKPKDPITTHKLTGIPKTGHKFSELPRLQVVMLTQIWLAHPQIRHNDMILDPTNWDNMPQPLIDWQPIKNTSQQTAENLVTAPWATV